MAYLHTSILAALNRLAPRIRVWLGVLGLLEVSVAVLAWVLLAWGLDWAFELPRVARALLLVVGGVGAALAVRSARRRLSRRFELSDLAGIVETSEPDLEGHLLNVLELPQELRALGEDKVLERHLLSKALEESTEEASRVGVRARFSLRPVLVRAGLSAAAAAILLLLVLAAPAVFGQWFRRGILLADEPWPRKTHFFLDRPEEDWHCARKDPLEVTGWVAGVLPRQMILRLEGASSRRDIPLQPGIAGEVPAALRRDAEPSGPLPARRLVFVLPSLTEDLELRVFGGDGESRTVRVHAHDRPRILKTQFALGFPEYLRKAAETVENPAGELRIPAGTTIGVSLEVDQELAQAGFRWSGGERQPLEVTGSRASGTFSPKENGVLELLVTAKAHDLEALPPLRVPVVVVPDRAPSVTLQIEGDARTVTPRGRIRYKVVGTDDHGFSTLALDVWPTAAGDAGAEEKPPTRISLEGGSGTGEGTVLSTAEGEVSVATWALLKGSTLTLQAFVADNDLPGGPKTAVSQKESFTVVDPEALQKELEKVRLEAQATLEELARREERLAGELARRARDEEPPREPRREPEASREPANSAKSAGSKSTSKSSAKSGKTSRASSPGARAAESPPTEAGETGDPQGESQSPDERSEPSQSTSRSKESSPPSKGAQGKERPTRDPARTPPDPERAGQPQETPGETPPEQANTQETESPEESSAREPEQGEQPSGVPPTGRQPTGRPSTSGQQKPSSSRQQSGTQNQESPSSEQAAQEAPEAGQEQESPQSGPEQLAEEQTEIGREARRVAERLRQLGRALRDNALLEPAEERRYQEEVEEPLERIAEQKLPESASAIEGLEKKDPRSAEAETVQLQAEKLSDEIKGVADKLAGTGNFREILQRLELIIDLQKKAIEETEKQAPPAPGGEKERSL